MVGWRGKEHVYARAYFSLAAITLAFGLASWEMHAHRGLCEPAVRVVHDVVWNTRGVRVPYHPEYFRFYVAFVASWGVLTGLLLAYGLVSHRALDAKVDRYLVGRLPQHQIVVERHSDDDGNE